MPEVFQGRLAIQQRVLPSYRAPFFDILAAACAGGASVLAGQPRPDEQIISVEQLEIARLVRAHNWHWLRVNSPFYQCWQMGLVSWLESWQPDILIVEANPRYLSTPRAVRWMHNRNRPVLGWGLGAAPLGGFLASWRGQRRKSFLASLDALISYSRRGAVEYQALGFPAERIFVAPNAVTPRPSAAPPQRPESFSIRPSVLFVGRLQARKRVDSLLRACAALPESMQPDLTIVGDGPSRMEIQALARQVYPGAKFPGSLHGAELEQYFAKADLFVLPGTGGLAVQEAMAHALPVIVAQGDGTQDDLVREQNGWRVPAGDLPALTSTLQLALADPLRLRKMGAASFRIVSEEVNLEEMVSVFMRALSRVIE